MNIETFLEKYKFFKKYFFIPVILIVFSLGAALGIISFVYFDSCKGRFVHINNDLACNYEPVVDKSNPIGLREELVLLIEERKKSGDILKASVFFRDLQAGPTLGIDENEQFIPASLLKLPVAISFYKLQEEEIPNLLQRRLKYSGRNENSEILSQYYEPDVKIKEGESYSIEELIFNTMVYSDNASNEVLKAALESVRPTDNVLLRTYRELGLISPKSNEESSLSTRGYASIFRLLYNSSYLNPDDSEKLLELLSQSKFDMGIAAGIPEKTEVANKLGERFEGKEKQLHDCGIIYFPDNPYILCVMTRGEDFKKLEKFIQEVSSKVYEEMENRKVN